MSRDIRQLELRSRYGANVIAVRQGDDLSIPPDIDAPMEADSILVMLGSYEMMDKLKKK